MVTVRDGQNLYDIALQHAGSLMATTEIAEANNLSVTADLAKGQALQIPKVWNMALVKFYKDNKIIIATE